MSSRDNNRKFSFCLEEFLSENSEMDKFLIDANYNDGTNIASIMQDPEGWNRFFRLVCHKEPEEEEEETEEEGGGGTNLFGTAKIWFKDLGFIHK